MGRDSFEEHAIHGTVDFPVGIYDTHFEPAHRILFSLHYHREFELLLVTRGKVRLQLEGDTFYLNQGEGIFINSGALHSAESSEHQECGFIAIVFSPEFIAAKHENSYETYIRSVMDNELVIPRPLTDDIIAIMRETNGWFQSRSFGYELFIKSNLLHIMALCMAKARQSRRRKNDNKMDVVKNAIDYIHNNYQNAITLQDMADHTHVSREHLCRVFKEVAESSPVVYLNRYRVLQSAYLLRDTCKSISEISSQCGFTNSSYFNKLFLRFLKCTPGEYRRKHR